MSILATHFDWSLVQSFLAIAETGSLTGAAKKLNKSQPTLGRDLSKMEKSLNIDLFHRERHGLALTEQGEELLDIAKQMQSSAAKLMMQAAIATDQMSGTVRVTASIVVSNHIIPPIFAKIRQKYPNIDLELHASDASENLLFHEADVAIRMYRPDQLDIITRYIGDIKIGLFASQSFLEKHGTPKTPDDLKSFDVIGYDRSELIIKGMRNFGWNVDRDFFKIRCDDQETYWQLVKSGCGIGFGQAKLGQIDQDLIQLFPDLDIPSLPVWLTAPQSLKHSRRIRAVYDMLASDLSEYVHSTSSAITAG